MTIIAKDYCPNGIEWTCYHCNRDRTFKAGKPPVFGADPCPVCGELRKPYVYPTRKEMEAAGCLPDPRLKSMELTRVCINEAGEITKEQLDNAVAVFKPNPEYLKPAGYCLEAPPRVLRVLPPVNAGYYEDGSLTGEVGRALDDVIRLACDPQRTVDWDE